MRILTFIFCFNLLWRIRLEEIAGIAGILIAVAAATFGIILLCIVLGIFLRKRELKEKIKPLQAFAAQNGWDFVPYATEDYFQNSSRHSLFGKDFVGRIIALIQKPFDGGQIFVFDYSRTSKKSDQTQKMTVIAFHSPRLQLPYFSLYPESSWSFLGELIGWNDIDFPSHPNFSKRYKLSSEDETQVRQTFRPQVLTAFENLPDVSFEGGENYIFIYTPKQTIAVESLNTHLGNAKKIYDLFRRQDDNFQAAKND